VPGRREVAEKGCYELVDQDGTLLGPLDKGVLSIGPTSYRFKKVGVVDGAGRIILSWPKPRLSNLLKMSNKRYRIDLADGLLLEFLRHADHWMMTWDVAEMADHSSAVPMTLRWRVFKSVGEAVVAPRRRLRADQILLTGYAFQVFDRVCVGHRGPTFPLSR
jgi:hypothetical protein